MKATLAAMALAAQSALAAKVLMTTSGSVRVYNYDGSAFTEELKASVDGAPTWSYFKEPNLLYTVNEWASDLKVYELEVGESASNLSAAIATGTGSSGVVHLEPNPAADRLVGSGYGAGTVDIWDISDPARLTLLKTIPSEGELGPVQPNQAAPHPHQAVLDGSGRFFFVNDLGTDSILVIDSLNDAWEVVRSVKTPAGCGPRHGVAIEETAYLVVCELSNQIIKYELSYLENDVEFTEAQTISTFGPDGATPPGAAAGELALGKGGSHVYASNRLTGGEADSIAVFDYSSGSLAFTQLVSSGGALPRMFSLSNEGTDLFVGNQNGPLAAVAFGVNSAGDGKITEQPKASLPLSDFGEQGYGPAYLQQIA